MTNSRGLDVKIGMQVQLKAFERPNDPEVFGVVECFHPLKPELVIVNLGDGGFYGRGTGSEVFVGELVCHIDNLKEPCLDEEE